MIANILYFIIKNLAELMIHSFFKDIHIIGKENLPKDGPVILCGTHNSQYVDGMMLMLTSKRPVNFLIAEKSTRHKLLKYFLKFMNVVPVTRSIDLKKKGKGSIHMINLATNILKGKDSQFEDQVNPADTLRVTIKVKEEKLPFVYFFQVSEIIDQSTLKIKISPEDTNSIKQNKLFKKFNENEIELNAEFHVLPKLNQKKVFQGTLDALNANKVIGIFPEGGSHDQTKLIDIKPGAVIFQYKYFEATGKTCPVIPIGLNYFGSHKFRSKVVINVGTPLKFTLTEGDRPKMSGKGVN
jgi:glycerol-3-phosphate O-acyltransferase/dihydroxyacetone phosphate acyltransferase